MSKLVIASGNAGKLREIARILAPLDIEAVPQSEFNVPDCPEPHVTFVENCLAKARHASAHSGLPALADDSGICVEALGGAPGVYSARYAGEPKSDARNNDKLIAALANQSNRRAHYYLRHGLRAPPRRPRAGDRRRPLVWRNHRHPARRERLRLRPVFPRPGIRAKPAPNSTRTPRTPFSHRGQALRELVDKLKQLQRLG